MTKIPAGEVAPRKKLNAIFAAIIVALVIGGVLATNAFGQSVAAKSAVVKDSDNSEYVLDLSKDSTTVVSTELGTNLVVVENGTVRVSEADCPNHDCVNQGAISKAGQQIVCLPHKLTIDISDREAAPTYDVVGK